MFNTHQKYAVVLFDFSEDPFKGCLWVGLGLLDIHVHACEKAQRYSKYSCCLKLLLNKPIRVTPLPLYHMQALKKIDCYFCKLKINHISTVNDNYYWSSWRWCEDHYWRKWRSLPRESVSQIQGFQPYRMFQNSKSGAFLGLLKSPQRDTPIS